MRTAPNQAFLVSGAVVKIRVSCIPITLLLSFSLLLPLAAEQPVARPVADWIASGVIYEINPRTFSAAGNFRGIESKLDDLKDLGVTILWLMPIHPVGQLKKKGTIGSAYAVQDYYGINPSYGTKDDLKHLVAETHKRGLKIIIDIVANHTAWDSVLMRQLAPVQLLTWLGLFCMWLYFPVAVARNVFGAPDTTSPLYAEGVEWGGICFAVYSAVCFAFSLVLPVIANKLGRKNTHSLCLLGGALGLISVAIIHDKYVLLLTMVGVGIAWASTLSMPYAVLAGSLPSGKTGVYMGIFNFFIVIPEILASLFFGWVMNHLLGNNRIAAVVAGGFFMAIAAALMQRVVDRTDAVSVKVAKPAELQAAGAE